MPLLLLVLVVAPLVELYVLIQVGQVIGALWTIGLLVAVSLLGAALLRREGGRAFRSFQEAARGGRVPTKEATDGALVLLGGALLLTPGFVSDVLGLLLVLPPTRALVRGRVTAWALRRLGAPALLLRPRRGRGGPVGPPHRWSRVVDGEVVDRDRTRRDEPS